MGSVLGIAQGQRGCGQIEGRLRMLLEHVGCGADRVGLLDRQRGFQHRGGVQQRQALLDIVQHPRNHRPGAGMHLGIVEGFLGGVLGFQRDRLLAGE